MEEDLVVEKSKIKQVSDDLNAVFEDLMWLMYVLIDIIGISWMYFTFSVKKLLQNFKH